MCLLILKYFEKTCEPIFNVLPACNISYKQCYKVTNMKHKDFQTQYREPDTSVGRPMRVSLQECRDISVC